MFKNLSQVGTDSNFLFLVDYDKYDINASSIYFKNKLLPSLGACSSVRFKNRFVGRNYDWLYNNSASFVIQVPAHGNRHASIGTIGGITELTLDFVKAGTYDAIYEHLPYYTLDGINDAGLAVNINVVPAGDLGLTTGTTPRVRKQYELCQLMLPRFILDNFVTARQAVNYINDFVSVYGINNSDYTEELHLMVNDPNECFVLEFIDNKVSIVECSDMKLDNGVNAIMTNFYLTDSRYNESGIVKSSLTEHATGIERYNILFNETSDDLSGFLQDVYATKMYTSSDPVFYSDYNGEWDDYGDLTINSEESAYAGIIADSKDLYGARDRSTGLTWQTINSVRYDLQNLSLILCTQENPSVTFEYQLEHSAPVEHKILSRDLVSLTVEENGDYRPSQGKGFSLVTANVSGSSGPLVYKLYAYKMSVDDDTIAYAEKDSPEVGDVIFLKATMSQGPITDPSQLTVMGEIATVGMEGAITVEIHEGETPIAFIRDATDDWEEDITDVKDTVDVTTNGLSITQKGKVTKAINVSVSTPEPEIVLPDRVANVGAVDPTTGSVNSSSLTITGYSRLVCMRATTKVFDVTSVEDIPTEEMSWTSGPNSFKMQFSNITENSVTLTVTVVSWATRAGDVMPTLLVYN